MKIYKLKIVAAKADEPTEILVHGPIGKSFWSDEGISGKEVTDAINAVPVGKKIIIGVNSQGGSIGEGLAIHNAIARRASDITVRIDGYALSIASFFPLAAGKVISPKSSVWMIHKGWNYSEGNADDHRKNAELLDVHDQVLVDAYVAATGKTEDEIRAAMSAETWLTGAEAVEWGLADEESDGPVALDALDFSAAPKGAFQNVPGAFAAVLKLPPALAGGGLNQNDNPNQPPAKAGQTNNPMRKKIIALLKKRGITFAETATDEELSALLESSEPAAAAPAQPANVISLQTEMAAVRAQLDRERNDRVTRAVDQHILDGRLNNTEREDAIARALLDDKYLDVIAKRDQILPGGTPLAIHGAIQFGAVGPMDHVKQQKTPRARFNFMRDNWAQLRQAVVAQATRAMRGMPIGANTTDADLVTAMLVEGATTILQNRLAPLRAFSKEVSLDRLKPKAILQHRKITAGGTAQTNATNFEDAANFIGVETNVPITVAQITSGGHITNAERQNGVTMAQWVEIKTAEISDAIMAVVAAVITAANFPADVLTSVAAAFGDAELKVLWGQLKKSGIKNIILDGPYYAQFLPTDRFDFDVTEYRNRGWDNFLLNTAWTGADANTVGFACHPQAIVVGLGLPLRSDRADRVSNETILTLPGLGVSVSINDWFSNISRNDWTTYDVMIGAAANDTTAGVLIKSQ